MKKTITVVVCMFFSLAIVAQLKAKVACGTFVVDVLNGTLNGIKPNLTMQEIKDKLPCFSSVDPEGGTTKCGGDLFYKDQDVHFYTERDYIQIGEKFKGNLSIPLLGANRKDLFKWLGNAKIKDDTWDAFAMAFGTLVLHYTTANKVKYFQFSTKSTDVLSLCE